MAGKTLYIDCFSGVSGDMFVAALLDLGAGSLAMLEESLRQLGIDGWSIRNERVKISGMMAGRFTVEVDAGKTTPRSLAGINELIGGSRLPEKVRADSLAVFASLGRAEAEVHGSPIEDVHFHEVGMVDGIIDIVSCCLLLDALGPDRVVSSPVTLGSGMVETRHGLMPVPSPATAKLLTGIPVLQGEERAELATPTGAALVSHFASSFGPLPAMTLAATGYGAGTHETVGPNLLRLLLGEEEPSPGGPADGPEAGTQMLLETNIDDSTPELTGFLAERLLAAGAADCWLTPVLMKKGRPGVVLSVLAAAGEIDRFLDIIFMESSTFGVRVGKVERRCLERRLETVTTPYGQIAVKIGSWRGKRTSVSPEYEDCRRAAAEHQVPLSHVYEAARAAVK